MSRQGGQSFETEFAPDALEDVLGRVGSFAQPVALPGGLAAAAGSSRSGLAGQAAQFRHPFQGFGGVGRTGERILGFAAGLVVAVPGIGRVRGAGRFPSSHGRRN